MAGTQIEARFKNGEWYHATILRTEGTKFLVNSILSHPCYSEWIEQPENIAKLGTYTESKELKAPDYFFCNICGWSNKDVCERVHGD